MREVIPPSSAASASTPAGSRSAASRWAASAPTTSRSSTRAASARSAATPPRSGSTARETAPGAFDDAADFERNDVVGTVQADPDAFGDDPGLERLRRRQTPSASTTKASSQRDGSRRRRLHHPLLAGRPRQAATGTPTGPPTCASTPTPWPTAASAVALCRPCGDKAPRTRSAAGRAGGGVPGGGGGPQLSRPSAVAIGIDGPAIAGRVEGDVGDRLDPREHLADFALRRPGSRSGAGRRSRPVASIPASSARNSARGMWKPWVTTTASLDAEDAARPHHRRPGVEPGVVLEDVPRRHPVARPAPCASCRARRRPRCGGRRRRGSSRPCPRARAAPPARPGRPSIALIFPFGCTSAPGTIATSAARHVGDLAGRLPARAQQDVGVRAHDDQHEQRPRQRSQPSKAAATAATDRSASPPDRSAPTPSTQANKPCDHPARPASASERRGRVPLARAAS